ncbi:hypothetical protein [Pseudofulvibacter geojedonensis]|uniref:Uncharacterized protein n=1 Tax=Pseudofulvibacter geojedonensis TaxID=1123758 RepID=A0ABW3HY34_9FLAO
MITLVLILLTLVAAVVLVKLIDKFVPQKTKWIFTILFWLIAVFVGWKLYDSIMAPIEFKKEKEIRYAKVIENLKDIRDAQIAHKAVTGKYSKDFNALVRFIDTAEYTLTQRRDSSINDEEYFKTYGVENTKDIVIIDTIGTASVKDSIFKNSDRYKTMMNVPGSDQIFKLDAGEIEKGKSMLPVFEAKISKKYLLEDQPKNLVAEELELQAVDGVNGEFISVGSMDEVSTNGNWPRKYDEEK